MHILKNRILTIKSIFIILVVLTALVVFLMFFDQSNLSGSINPFVLWALLTLAGVGLVLTVNQARLGGKVRVFLLLAGYAAAAFLVGIVLHNLFYALTPTVSASVLLTSVLGFLEGTFFVLAVIVCPLALLVGMLGTVVLWRQIPAAK
ncbi:MAG: hypothetical protein PWQ55_121 [Chloroflexota bacterium]|nr:hypothetical protein [Chloroflexota bacterium]